MQEALNSAIAGKGSTLFVSGEAGCGKTRVTSEFLERARKKGVTILKGWCLSKAAVPFFPFVEALGSFFAENEEENSRSSEPLGLKTWLLTLNTQERLKGQEGMSSQAWKEQKFSAVTKQLLFLSADRPLILFIDDLHWADSASLSLLHYLSGAIKSERVFILTTFRSEELGSSAEGYPNPLLDTLLLMDREDLFKEVKLPNLNQKDVAKIAENMLGGKVSEELVEKLANESRGNPLFVIESLRMLSENGNLIKAKEQWHLAMDKMGIPTKVKDIILRRLNALKPGQRRILDVASVIGDKFDPQLLGSVLNQDSLEILETLNSIALSKSLVCVEGNYYRFDHAKSREVLYEEILLPLKIGYHERVAERIESLAEDARQLPLADLAYHYAQAGNKSKSIKYNLAAGKDAFARFSNTEAIKHFTFVIENTGGLASLLNEKIDALDGLGSALVEDGRQSESIKVFEQLYETAQSDLIKLRALRRAMWAATYQGDLVAVQRLAAKAEDIPFADRLEHARVRLYMATADIFGERSTQAIENIEAALQVFEEEGSLSDIGDALIEAGIIYGKAGRLEESLSSGLRSQALFKDADDLTKVLVYGHLSYDYLACGQYEQTIKTASEGIRLGQKIENQRTAWLYFFSAAAHELLAGVIAASGQTAEAAQYMATAMAQNQEGAKIAEKTDGYYILSAIYNGLSREYLASGNMQEAENFQEKFQRLKDEFGPRMEKSLSEEALGLTALLCAARSQWKDANECYEKILSAHANDTKYNVFHAFQHLSYAKVLAMQGKLLEARTQMEQGQAMMKKIIAKFEHTNIQACLLAPKQVEIGQPFDLVIDVTNISKKSGNLTKLQNIASTEFKIKATKPECTSLDGSIQLINTRIEPFSVNSLKLSLQPTKKGVFTFIPKAEYVDDLGQTKFLQPYPITIIVESAHPKNGVCSKAEGQQFEIDLQAEFSRKAFDYLTASFKEDYIGHKLPLDQSGWRTLMRIVKEAKVSKYSVYGSSGSRGQVIAELERGGLIEARIFRRERGRGGQIFKVRVAPEKFAEKK